MLSWRGEIIWGRCKTDFQPKQQILLAIFFQTNRRKILKSRQVFPLKIPSVAKNMELKTYPLKLFSFGKYVQRPNLILTQLLIWSNWDVIQSVSNLSALGKRFHWIWQLFGSKNCPDCLQICESVLRETKKRKQPSKKLFSIEWSSLLPLTYCFGMVFREMLCKLDSWFHMRTSNVKIYFCYHHQHKNDWRNSGGTLWQKETKRRQTES